MPLLRLDAVDAVSFDFYNTLAQLRDGFGRGRLLADYFAAEGLASDPWEHRVLYDAFQPDTPEATLGLSDAAREAYLTGLTGRLFDRMNVRGPGVSVSDHAERIWGLIGPASFVLFPEVLATLGRLRGAGVPLVIVSNWPCGLKHFCADLGLAAYFDHIFCSAEMGLEKPDPRIFHEACRALGTDPARTLHVGDTVLDDVHGAVGAGLQAILVQRTPVEGTVPNEAIAGLGEIPALLGLAEPSIR